MSKSNAYALEKQTELEELYTKVEEAVIAMDQAEELKGFNSLKHEHKDLHFYLIKKDLEEFLSILDDYVRGDE
tara:strand:+ start:792 stop:1010 length:219 start_codon:yes stop_codon:yes gene_type:complete